MLLFPVLKRALKETLLAVSASPRSILVSIVSIIGFFFLMWWIRGEQKAMDEIIDYAIAVAAAVGFVIVPVFLWNLWLTPYRMMEERLDAAIGKNKLPPDNAYREAPPIDVAEWQRTEIFQLGDAACLWVRVLPHNPISDTTALAAFKRMSGAIVSGHLQAAPAGLGGLSNLLNGEPWWPKHAHKVTAVALRRYADAIGDVPEFLKHVTLPPKTTVDNEESNDKTEKTL